MCFGTLEKNGTRTVKAVCLVALLVLIFLCIYRMRGKTLEQSIYSEGFGEIKVKEIEMPPVSLKGLMGIGDKLYRCEFRRSPGGILESAISLQLESYQAQKVEVSWHSARKATVSFDGAIFYEIEEGVWKKSANLSSKVKSSR